MYLVIVMVVYIFFAIRFVDWGKWKEYYPTIQYFIIFNLLYNFLFYNHTLWAYKAKTVDWLNHTIIEVSFTFFIVPVVIMMYLRYYPKGWKQMIYVSVWVAYFSTIEILFAKKGLFIYANGWGPFMSTIFNLVLFVMLRIHYQRPLYGLLVPIPIIIVLLYFFHPSLSELK